MKSENKKTELRAKFNLFGCSAWGCSWYFIVSKVVTVKCKKSILRGLFLTAPPAPAILYKEQNLKIDFDGRLYYIVR